MRLIRRVRPLLEYPFVQFQVFTTKTNCSKYVVTSENILAKKTPFKVHDKNVTKSLQLLGCLRN